MGEQQNSHPREEKKTHLCIPHLEVKKAISGKEGIRRNQFWGFQGYESDGGV